MIRSEVVEKKEEKKRHQWNFPTLVETNNSVIIYFSKDEAYCLRQKNEYGFPIGKLNHDPYYVLAWDDARPFTGTIQLSNE